MISKKYRINKKIDIDRLRMEKNILVRTKFFLVKEVNNLDNQNPRFLISISKKYSKKAVDRNKLKRRMFSKISKIANIFKLYCDYHFICVRRTIMSKQDLEQDFELITKSFKI